MIFTNGVSRIITADLRLVTARAGGTSFVIVISFSLPYFFAVLDKLSTTYARLDRARNVPSKVEIRHSVFGYSQSCISISRSWRKSGSLNRHSSSASQCSPHVPHNWVSSTPPRKEAPQQLDTFIPWFVTLLSITILYYIILSVKSKRWISEEKPINKQKTTQEDGWLLCVEV